MKILSEIEQGSQEWHEARLEKVSGTRVSDAIGTSIKQDSLINELIAELLTGEQRELVQSAAMRLGSEAEEFAIQEYEQETGYITEEVGLCISDDYEWLVSSPDRLIRNDAGKYTRAVEVKSPNPETAVKYIRNDEIPKEYLGQVYGYFLVNSDLEELDFVVYSPKFSNQYRLWIKTVRRSDLDLDSVKEKIIKFRERWEAALKKLNLTI